MKISLTFLLPLFISATYAAHAAPDAGQLLQEIEKQRGVELLKPSLPEIAPAPQPMRSIDGMSVTISQFTFIGNTLISNSELEEVVKSYLNRTLSFVDLQQAAANVAKSYRDAGWIVRAYLPQQDIKQGRITIQIVEAVFGGARLEGDEPTRFNSNAAINMIETAQPKNTLLNGDKIDRALLLLNDLPGITATGTLIKGVKQSETDIVIKLADEPLFSGNMGIDNASSYSTGSERITANLKVSSPRKIGDQAIANLSHSKGNDYLRIAYSLPVEKDGWRVGASGSYLNYEIVEGDFKDAEIDGNSSTVGIDASYPIIRSRLRNLTLGLNYDHKAFENKAANVITTDYSVDNTSISLNGNLFDKLGGGGANSASISLTHGNLNFNDQDNRKGGSTNLEGEFTKLNYYLSRQQVITNSVSLYSALSGQEASKKLDSSEKLYLGGAYGVRAYPSNEGSGSEGQLANIELRWRLPLPENITITGFYDLGHVSKTDTTPTSYTLKGAGISSSYTTKSGLNLKATWARRIGDNPNPAANGDDQDGTLHKNRFWLQATTQF